LRPGLVLLADAGTVQEVVKVAVKLFTVAMARLEFSTGMGKNIK